MQKIVTHLWFDDQAEEAANFYVSLFEDSQVLDVSRYMEGSPGEPGKVMTVTFQLNGQEFIALNGGPEFKFNESMSLFVKCETQEEVDRLWAALTDGGEEQPCGWLKDKYGLSWQIIPNVLGEMLQDENPDRAQRVMEAMLKMKKIDVSKLTAAYDAA